MERGYGWVALVKKESSGMFALGSPMCYCACVVLIGTPYCETSDKTMCSWQCYFASTLTLFNNLNLILSPRFSEKSFCLFRIHISPPPFSYCWAAFFFVMFDIGFCNCHTYVPCSLYLMDALFFKKTNNSFPLLYSDKVLHIVFHHVIFTKNTYVDLWCKKFVQITFLSENVPAVCIIVSRCTTKHYSP